MSTRQTITASGHSRSHTPERTTEDHLDLLERNLESLKAEMAAGTPIDPQKIADLEKRLIKLRPTTKFC